jgi:glutamine synthetase
LGGKKDALQKKLVEMSALIDDASVKAGKLDVEKTAAKAETGALPQAQAYRDKVFMAIEALREPIDRLEKLMPKDYWPMPTYEELLFRL